MNLKDYITSIEKASSLAERLKVPNVSISNWANGKRPIPIRLMPAIEKATEGHVTRKDLCPEWEKIWPELANKPESDSQNAA